MLRQKFEVYLYFFSENDYNLMQIGAYEYKLILQKYR